MTDIATNLDTIDGSLSDIKTAIVAKGVTPSGNITTFATAISGITPLNGETVNITPSTSAQTITPTSPANGITQANVSAVTSSIDANIIAGNIKDGVTILGVTGNYSGGGSVPDGYIPRVNVNGALKAPTTSFTYTLPSGITSLADYALCGAFYQSGLTGILDLSSVVSIGTSSCSSMCYLCQSVTGCDFSSLQTVGAGGLQYAFLNCLHITSMNFPSLTVISTMGFQMAFAVSGITSLSFPSLTSSSFGNRTDQFNNMLNRVSNCTVHFPSSLENTLLQWTDVTNGFGGTNTTVLFDL